MEPFIWLAALAVLLIAEAVTAGLTTIWFAGVHLWLLLPPILGQGSRFSGDFF